MKALIVVDVQNDFCPGGALAVKDGDTIVPGINTLSKMFEIIVTTQDWHPQNHGSFASNHEEAQPFETGTLSGRRQILWPDHCVQETHGAQLHEDLSVRAQNFVKGTNPAADSYSGFFDDDGSSTGLHEYLQDKKVTHVYVCGLATDYCVKYTAQDAIKLGYSTTVIENLCKAVNISPDDSMKALAELLDAGAIISNSANLIISEV